METIIKLRGEELSLSLLTRIKEFIDSDKKYDVTISLKEVEPTYHESLAKSITYAEGGNQLITFSMEEFLNYSSRSDKEK